jgi:branched-chain amino acid transport system permease protein
MDRDLTRWALRMGRYGGFAILYFSAVGMVTTFDARNLVGIQITLGKILVWTPPLLVGYLAARPRRRAEGEVALEPRQVALTGVLAGLAAGVVVAIAVIVVELIGVDVVRNVLVSVSQELIDILTFHMAVGVGLVLFVVMTIFLGTLGASLRLIPPLPRRMVVGGVVAVVFMGLLQRIIPTALHELHIQSKWLYDPILGGLTKIGAVLIFVVTAGVIYVVGRFGGAIRTTVGVDAEGGHNAARSGALLVLAVVLIALPQLVGSIVSDVLGFVGIGLMLALGLNIIVGNAGLLHLGFVVFYTIGAYTTALLMGASPVTALGIAPPVLPFHLSFYAALPIVVAVAAVIGVLIAAPTVRLRGDYLAIVTLGFGAIASVLVQSDWLKNVLGGPQGLRNIPAAPLFGIEMRSPQHFYYLALAACIVGVFVSWRLTNSRVGRAWNAMREDEQVAEAMGISVVRYKLLASAVGGGLGAVGGALFAVKIASLSSASFTILVSITALAIIILGGLGSIRGAVVGALILVGLPNLLSEFENYRLSIYGAVLIAIMLFRPQGLLPNVRRARELRDEERAQDQWLKEHDPEVAAELEDGAVT